MGRVCQPPVSTRVRTALATACAVLLLGVAAYAQTPSQPPVPDEPPPSPEPAPIDVFSTMRIRGYADVGFGNPLQEKLPVGGLQEATASFQIADLHLFITTRLSDEWSFLSEVLITSDFSNETTVELDRLLVQYDPSKYFRVAVGKFNSAVGYYTNQFHRAKFYQTATGRPVMFTDDDNGGVLPVHQVGVTVHGQIPSGSLGLHYVGEVSNGRGFFATGIDQNFVDSNNGKAVNGGLYLQPDALPALDAGFTVYRDTLEPLGHGRVAETITTLHGVWLTPGFEFLNEIAFINHDPESGGAQETSTTAYTQLSRRFGVIRPYARYDYQDVPPTDPIFGLEESTVPVGIRKAISGGVNVAIKTFAVFKVQVDRALERGVWANGAHVQLAVAF